MLVTGWNGVFFISIGALVITTVTPSIKLVADVDVVLGVKLEEDNVAVTVWNGGSSISTGALVTTIGTAALGGGLSVFIVYFVTTCSSSSVLSSYIGS